MSLAPAGSDNAIILWAPVRPAPALAPPPPRHEGARPGAPPARPAGHRRADQPGRQAAVRWFAQQLQQINSASRE